MARMARTKCKKATHSRLDGAAFTSRAGRATFASLRTTPSHHEPNPKPREPSMTEAHQEMNQTRDFSSRRAQLQELESSSPDVDLSFADVEASTSSQLDKSFPSAESLSYARTTASPEFSAEHPLLDSIATIFSDSDVAQTKLTSLMAKRDEFHNKRRRAEAMEQENLSVRDQIHNLTVEYDVCEDVVKRLEREISEHRSKMFDLG
ncbi:transcription factor HBP-1a-like [Dorcoceras hygrometricum]|uniref:Transcription factor HBP-1a-like n=1 Tax=Dorcoceras hygrometricum TaxID=472368 RepID=A0A2Z7BDD7_9LAMI|nr:transcription factor HBP-1a-like [Dorcoceras hygrometricum]